MNVFRKVNSIIFKDSEEYPPNGAIKTITLGMQHAFSMSCATILVPLLTGLDVGVALFCAGIGTLIFHICTRGRMPTFLGSSFAFISALCMIIGNERFGANKEKQIAAATGGIIAAGLIYVIIAITIKFFGSQFIQKMFPPIVRGIGITLIGLNLSSSAISNIQPLDKSGALIFDAEYYWSWSIAIIVCLIAVILSSYGKGIIKMSSIFSSLVLGYIFTFVVVKLNLAPSNLMDINSLALEGRGFSRTWFEIPNFTLPRLDFTAISIIAPIAIVTCVEHIGDVYANGAVVRKDFTKKPGFFRTFLGDGLATMFAGFVGGPANTTYSENTAVLAATGNYSPVSLRLAALISIVISFFGKAIGVLETVPGCVLGGACILLYGMIASVGLRTLVENHVDFTKNRNLCIAAVMLVLSIGGAVIGTETFNFKDIGLGIIAGIILNLILPDNRKPNLIAHSVSEENVFDESVDI